jgi:DNA polymerase elongation subunit (family B)
MELCSVLINVQYYQLYFDKWFDERVEYKGYMKKAYKAGDKEKGAFWHQRQHTMKILLNSLYGATALGSLDMVV